MAYVQKNNPFPVTSCGRRRTFTQGGSPGKDRTEESPFLRTKPHTSWTQADRDKYNRENPGKKNRPPQPEGGPRKDSYCARSAGIKKCKNPPCPNTLSRKKWKCQGKRSVC